MLTHPQVPGQCARFLRAELAHARVLPAELDGGGRAHGDRRRRRAGTAAIGTVLAASIYGGTVLREGVEDRDDNETRFVWLARGGEARQPPLRRRAPARRRGVEDLARVLGRAAPRAPAGWCAASTSSPRREINLTKIESRPRRERLGRLHVLRRPRRPRRRRSRRARRSTGCARSCEDVRVLGSYPRRRAGRCGRRRSGALSAPPRPADAPLDSRADDGEHCPTRAGGVRVAFRAPAART